MYKHYSRKELLDLRTKITLAGGPPNILFDVLDFTSKSAIPRPTRPRPIPIISKERGTRGGSRRQFYIPSVSKPWKNSKLQRSVNYDNLIKINPLPSTAQDNLSNQTTPLKIALVNAHSVRNKTSEVMDYVICKELDLCFLTETWLNDKDSVCRSALNIQGYTFQDYTRQDERQGGGTGIIHRSHMKCERVNGGQCASFEYQI